MVVWIQAPSGCTCGQVGSRRDAGGREQLHGRGCGEQVQIIHGTMLSPLSEQMQRLVTRTFIWHTNTVR